MKHNLHLIDYSLFYAKITKDAHEQNFRCIFNVVCILCFQYRHFILPTNTQHQ